MQDEKDIITQDSEEKELDLLELASKLWAHRKKLMKWGIIGAVVGLVIAISLPNEYATSAKLAPELSGEQSTGFSAIASMIGFGGGDYGNGTDAVYPDLYPDVVSSVPFLTDLFNVEVKTKKGGETMTVEQFLKTKTKAPWWSVVMAFPGKMIGKVVKFFMPEDEEPGAGHVLNNFQLTKKERGLVTALSERVTASVDQKNSVITINVQMQDPLVSAMLADTVVSRLQQYITNYRTNKARQDLIYSEILNEEAQKEYYRVQQVLAEYIDRNHALATQSAQITRDRLQNEASLAFSLYNQTAQQVQAAKAKVQEFTPIYAVIVPPTVPLKQSSPRRFLILVGFTFLACAGYSGWLLFLQPMLEEYKQKLAANNEQKD